MSSPKTLLKRPCGCLTTSLSAPNEYSRAESDEELLGVGHPVRVKKTDKAAYPEKTQFYI